MSATNKKALKEVGAMLSVLGAAIFVACLLALWAIRAFDEPRIYKAGDLFPSPQTAFHLAYAQTAGQGVRPRQYRFDHIVLHPFSRFIDKSAYTGFYTLIANDKSVKDPGSFDMAESFQLSIYVKELESAQMSTFAEMQIAAKGDLYRILLRDQGVEKHWVYFFHPNIRKQGLEILMGSHE